MTIVDLSFGDFWCVDVLFRDVYFGKVPFVDVNFSRFFAMEILFRSAMFHLAKCHFDVVFGKVWFGDGSFVKLTPTKCHLIPAYIPG